MLFIAVVFDFGRRFQGFLTPHEMAFVAQFGGSGAVVIVVQPYHWVCHVPHMEGGSGYFPFVHYGLAKWLTFYEVVCFYCV